MRLGEYFEIGKRMKQARTNAGINQRDMSVKLALTNSSYSNYENGYSEPPVETILKFCDILGITLNDLLEVFSCNLNRLRSSRIAYKGKYHLFTGKQSAYSTFIVRYTKCTNCYFYSGLEQGESAACRWTNRCGRI